MKILVTGSSGFIGKNFAIRISENPEQEVLEFVRGDSIDQLISCVEKCDAIVHLAGENRPKSSDAFMQVNGSFTEQLCDVIKSLGKAVPVVLASSIHAGDTSLYGQSKRVAETAVKRLADTGVPCIIYRLPGVFGKWAKPNYNSVVATFCHHIALGEDISIDDADKEIRIVYVDDLIEDILCVIKNCQTGVHYREISPTYTISVGKLAETIYEFKELRRLHTVNRVGLGLTRALYATFVSYLRPNQISVELKKNVDSRGNFVEILKTTDCGQISYFTLRPGCVRGNHYHHTKTEKFLVLQGNACFGFRDLATGETFEVVVDGDNPRLVETIPGWVHNITNTGKDDVLAVLWANEVFDHTCPDTIFSEVSNEKA